VYICRCDIRESDPPGRYRHEIAYDGANIYIFGGGTSTQAFDLTEIPTYNIEANTWEYTHTNPDPLLPDPGCYPDSRKCHSCIQFDTAEGMEVVIAGGFDGRRHFTDIWKLNLPTMTWHKFQTTALPQPLFFHDAAAHQDGCMYIFGGIKQDDGNTVRTNSIYKMYVTLPKLKVIAYEALLHYYSKRLRGLTKCQLLELGLPVVYAERLVTDV
jgi:Kelch motif